MNTTEALAVGNHKRIERARLRRLVKELPEKLGRYRVARWVNCPPECLYGLHVERLLVWVHRIGQSRAQRLLRAAQVSGTRPLDQLTERERQALKQELVG